MADKSSGKVDRGYDYQRIAKERFLWLMRPVTVVCIFVWCLYPSTVLYNLEGNVLLGFLLGTVAGLLVNWSVLRYYLFTRRQNTLERKNRMPDEYYFGKIKQVLYDKGRG